MGLCFYKLFSWVVGVDGFHEDVGDGFHGLRLDGIEVVAECVPEGEETAVGVVLHYVDGRYVGYLVDVEVVVENGVGLLVNENGGMASGCGNAPDFVHE